MAAEVLKVEYWRPIIVKYCRHVSEPGFGKSVRSPVHSELWFFPPRRRWSRLCLYPRIVRIPYSYPRAATYFPLMAATSDRPAPPQILLDSLFSQAQDLSGLSLYRGDDGGLFPTPKSPDDSRPYVTLTFAQSLDAKIAGKGGKQLALSGKESLVMTHWSVSRGYDARGLISSAAVRET